MGADVPFLAADHFLKLTLGQASTPSSVLSLCFLCAHILNLNFWESVGFSEALPNGRLAAESEKDEETMEQIAAAGKPEEDLCGGAADLCHMRKLRPRVFQDSMDGFSDPEDSKQKE